MESPNVKNKKFKGKEFGCNENEYKNLKKQTKFGGGDLLKNKRERTKEIRIEEFHLK